MRRETQPCLRGVLALALVGCGYARPADIGPGADAANDSADNGHALTIEIHRGFDGPLSDDATFVAVQDGDTGSFVELTGDAGSYTTTVVADRYAIAIGCIQQGATQHTVVFAHRTIEDDPLFRINCLPPDPPAAMLQLRSPNQPADQLMYVAVTNTLLVLTGGEPQTALVYPGEVDVIATTRTASGETDRVTRGVITVPQEGTSHSLDYDAGIPAEHHAAMAWPERPASSSR